MVNRKKAVAQTKIPLSGL